MKRAVSSRARGAAAAVAALAAAGALALGRSRVSSQAPAPPAAVTPAPPLATLDAAQRAIAAATRNPADASLALEAGRLSGDLGLTDEALLWFSRAEKAEPGLVPAITGQGQMWMALGRPLMAVRTYQRALKLAPSEPLLLVELARACTSLRDFETALRYARAAERLAPESPEVYRALALLRAEMLDAPGSLADAERATRLGPSDAENWILHASLLLRNRRPRDAQRAIERALALDPASASANVVYATALIEQHATPDTDRRAFAALSRAQLSAPGYAPATLLQAQILLRAGQLPLAVSAFRLGREADPTDPEAARGLGQALVRSGRAEEGVRIINEAQKLAPRGVNFSGVENQVLRNADPALVARLADLYLRQRLPDLAVNVLERALKRHPGTALLQEKLAAARREAARVGPTGQG